MPTRPNATYNSPSDSKAFRRAPATLVAIGLMFFCGFATYLFVRGGLDGLRGSRSLPSTFQLDLRNQFAMDSELLGYRADREIPLTLNDVRAFACGMDGRIYVADNQAIHVLSDTGQIERVIPVSRAPDCLAIGASDHMEPGRLYVAHADGVQVFDATGASITVWPLPHEQAAITSLAVASADVFLADAFHRVVWRYNVDGEQIGRIDLSETFAIPGGRFDIVVASEDLLYAANPGKLQIVTLTFAGDLGATWGKAGSSVSEFFGCCNPTHLAVLPDGQLVTSEKGLPRVKTYSPTGTLEAVVAAPEHLGVSLESIGDPRFAHQQGGFEIAVDGRGRVLVLDPHRPSIRVFIPIDGRAEAGVQS